MTLRSWLVLPVILALGCGHSASKIDSMTGIGAEATKNYSGNRIPAAAAYSPDFKDGFQKLDKDTQVLLFPKSIDRAMDDHKGASAAGAREEVVRFLKPIRFHFHSKWGPNNKCGTFTQNKKLGTFFDSMGDEEKKNIKCVALSIKPDKQRIAKANGTVSEVVLYMDEAYRGYGMEFTKFKSRYDANPVKRSLRLNPDEAVTSGLLLFPVDVPNSTMMEKAEAFKAADLKVFQDKYVSNKMIKEKYGQPKCDGKKLQYVTMYGQTSTAYWCPGDQWPSIIENDRYLAVVKQDGGGQ